MNKQTAATRRGRQRAEVQLNSDLEFPACVSQGQIRSAIACRRRDVAESPAPTSPNRLALRPKEAAKALGVSDRTLWSWTRERGIPVIIIGNTKLYVVAELEKWLAAQGRNQGQPAQGGDHAQA